MRGLALIGPSWPLRGGIARTTTALAAALATRGNLAGFFVATRQYPRWIYPGARDTDPRACRHLDVAQACFGVLEPLSWPGLRERVRRSRPEALVLPFWTAAWAPLESFLARRAPAGVVAIVHNPADHDAGWLARVAARAVLGRCQGFLCHAREVADTVDGRFPGIPTVVHPLPPEISTGGDRAAARMRLGVPPQATALLCFGLIRPYKGVDVLLDAVARLPRELGVVLLLAGEPWAGLGGELRRRLAQSDLAGRVVARLEWVPEDEAADWFTAADAAVLPYRSATGSAVAAQVLGYGLPVVASAVGGLKDVVEEGVNGLLVPPGDPAALAERLAQLAQPGVHDRLAAGARETARYWSWDSYARALEELVGRIRAPRGGTSTEAAHD